MLHRHIIIFVLLAAMLQNLAVAQPIVSEAVFGGGSDTQAEADQLNRQKRHISAGGIGFGGIVGGYSPVYTAPVYTAPIYTAPIYTAPIYTPVVHAAPAYIPTYHTGGYGGFTNYHVKGGFGFGGGFIG